MRLEKGQSIFSMLGGLEPSRAINASEGNDPVSMGMMPAVSGAAVPSAPPHAGPQPPSAQPEPPPQGARLPDGGLFPLVIDGEYATTPSRVIRLAPEHVAYIANIVLHALEFSMAQELLEIRSRYGLLPSFAEGPPMQQADAGDELVRQMQDETPPPYGEAPPEHPAPPLLEVPEATSGERSLRLVPSRSKRKPTAPPEA